MENCVDPLKRILFSPHCHQESVLSAPLHLALRTTADHPCTSYNDLLICGPHIKAFGTHKSCLGTHADDIVLSANGVPMVHAGAPIQVC